MLQIIRQALFQSWNEDQTCTTEYRCVAQDYVPGQNEYAATIGEIPIGYRTQVRRGGIIRCAVDTFGPQAGEERWFVQADWRQMLALQGS